MQKNVYTLAEATAKMEHYCAYQERCHKEVEQKLQSMGMIPDAANLVIAHLIEHKFLNETRFAKAFAQGKFRIKNWGKNRIVNELKQRHISAYNINEALKQIQQDEYTEVLYRLAQKKANSLTEKNLWKKRKKLTDYLLYRGWEAHLVYGVVNELVKVS
ncbi:MAG: regulatory protein RecX [Flavobacteriaceae bacterium]